MTLNAKNVTNIAIAALLLCLMTFASMYMLMKSDTRHVVGVVEVGEIQ